MRHQSPSPPARSGHHRGSRREYRGEYRRETDEHYSRNHRRDIEHGDNPGSVLDDFAHPDELARWGTTTAPLQNDVRSTGFEYSGFSVKVERDVAVDEKRKHDERDTDHDIYSHRVSRRKRTGSDEEADQNGGEKHRRRGYSRERHDTHGADSDRLSRRYDRDDDAGKRRGYQEERNSRRSRSRSPPRITEVSEESTESRRRKDSFLSMEKKASSQVVESPRKRRRDSISPHKESRSYAESDRHNASEPNTRDRSPRRDLDDVGKDRHRETRESGQQKERARVWDARRHRYRVIERSAISRPTEGSEVMSSEQLEEKARQRRLAVEEWRKHRAAEEVASSNGTAEGSSTVLGPVEQNGDDDRQGDAADESSKNREWDLDHDSDAEDPTTGDKLEATELRPDVKQDMVPIKATPIVEEDDVDPLDAYMAGVAVEMQHIRQEDARRIGIVLEAPTIAESIKQLEQDSESDVEEQEESLELKDILARAAAMKTTKRKEVPVADHSKINYEPFRKDFYSEPPELAEMSEVEVELFRTSLDGIKIRGLCCPKPIKNWAQSGLPAGCYGVIRKLGFEKPFPIQAQAIPAIMGGRDVIGIAKTGSGKTLAYLLPLFRHVLDQRPVETGDGPIALIMTPTRELAMQIFRECKPYLKVLNLRAVCSYGGSPIKDNIADMKRGAEIVVCTPGRMIDLLCANAGRVTNLKRVTYLVLDEADRMFDMGFEPQVMRIVGNIRPDRQTLLFSATFPRTMEALARKILKKPVEITVGTRSLVCDDVTQVVEVHEDDDKFLRLLEILGEVYKEGTDIKTLIFVDRQDAADNLLRDLMRRGYYCMSLHGGKDQMDRDSTIADFKSGEAQIMVATSVAARGLDVKNLGVVINYDAPNHMEDYVHRVGRTGRAGNKGTAYTFITPRQDKYAVDIAKALMMSDKKVPEAVQKLVDEYLEKVRTGQAYAKSSGFGGKGLDRLDRDRDIVRKAQKVTYGATGDDDEEEEDIEAIADELIESIENKQSAGTQPRLLTSTASSAAVVSAPPGVSSAAAEISAAVAASIERSKNEALEKARAAAAKINQAQGLPAFTPSELILPRAPAFNLPPPPLVSLQSTVTNKGHFTAEIEINDYPQKARWTVTRREHILQVYESTGASITTRGVYVPPNQTPKSQAERKLFLLIEAETENALDRARTEVKRALADATMLALEAESGRSSLGGGGRYSVL